MKRILFAMSGLLIIFPMVVSAQNWEPVNDIRFVEGQTIPQNQQIINTVFPTVVIYVDFLDSRLPNGLPPDDTTQLVPPVNINAVGSFGWYRTSPTSPFYKVIRKYTYEDYWDLWFSAGEWTGTRHPDFASHEGFVYPGYPPQNDSAWAYKLTLYGSLRDYWNETSYGNVQILPYQTRAGAADKYHTGIVNNVDVIGGRNHIRWIRLPQNKNYYVDPPCFRCPARDPNPDLYLKLVELHNLLPGNPDRIEFDITTYAGRYAIIGAGTNFGGYAYYPSGPYQVMPEKWGPHGYVPEYTNNTYQGTIFAPIGDYAHEFGHTIGFYHYQGGSYELMHWGGLRRINLNSPPHVNPWQKIVKGWIPPANIIMVSGNMQVQLPPIHNSPVVAVVSLFGEPGRDGRWGDDFDRGHSEFLVIENRQRLGFNRFSGGEFIPQQFTGGGLVWHYSSMTEFQNYAPPPANPPQLIKTIGMKTVGYGQPPYYQAANPDHFFPWHGTTLGEYTNPNSRTVGNSPTGISLHNFALNSGYLTFDVTVPGGSAPNYNIFIGPDYAVPSTWSGNVYCQQYAFNSPFNVTSIAPGTTAEVFGKIQSSSLSVVGTLSQPITLKGLGYGDYRQQWGGIEINSGGSANVSYTSVSKAKTGISCGSGALSVSNSNFTNCNIGIYSGNVPSTISSNTFSQCGTAISLLPGKRSPNISYNTITRCDIGIDLYNSMRPGYPTILSNSITAGGTGLYIHQTGRLFLDKNTVSTCETGLYVVSGAPLLRRNRFDSNIYNAVVSENAHPTFGSEYAYDQPGLNVLRYSGYADLFAIGGDPFLGLFEDENHIKGGFNSLYFSRGQPRCIVEAQDATVTAHANWWGDQDPPSGWFCGKVDYSKPLSYDPNEGSGGGFASFAVSLDAEEQMLRSAYVQKTNRNYVGALNAYKGFILNRSNSPRLQRAFRELGQTYRDYIAWANDTTIQRQFVNYLMPLARAASNTPTKRAAQILLAEEMHHRGELANAISEYGQVISRQPNSLNERTALFALYDIYAYNLLDKSVAQNILADLRRKYPNDRRVRLAEKRFDLVLQGGANRLAKGESANPEIVMGVPAEYVLHQNYPNPFNPTTTIRFAIPQNEHVTLKVYDLLGREVATLVDEARNGGSYNETFDASKLASGVYIYKLIAGNFSASKKLVVVK